MSNITLILVLAVGGQRLMTVLPSSVAHAQKTGGIATTLTEQERNICDT